MTSDNIRQLKVIAEGLSDLCKEVVFVGGAVTELYADDPASASTTRTKEPRRSPSSRPA